MPVKNLPTKKCRSDFSVSTAVFFLIHKCKRHPQKSECLNCPYGVYVRFQNNFLVLYSVNFTMDIFSNCNINIIADVVRIQKQVAVITFTYL